jgi:hypothetical protein
MRGSPAPPAQERQFWALIHSGMNPAQAARQVGMPRQWGWRRTRGVETSLSLAEHERIEQEQPAPKTLGRAQRRRSRGAQELLDLRRDVPAPPARTVA